MPSFSYTTVIKGLKKMGFVFKRQGKGSHEFWINPQTKQTILIAKHNKNIPNGTLSSIVKYLGFKNLRDFQDFINT